MTPSVNSLVEERPEVRVRNRIEILAYVDVDHPVKSLGPECVLQSAERLVSRAARAEAVGTGQEVLFVDRLQHHRHGALRHLVLEGWNAEHPLRAIRFRDVRPADRRRAIATGLDAFEKVQQVGLQVRLIILRRDAVDAGSAVLAGQPKGLPHPIQIDDVVERAQRRSPFRLRQIGYPLSVRGQVCRVQSPLPCFRSTVLYSWRLPSLRRVPASPVPRLHR